MLQPMMVHPYRLLCHDSAVSGWNDVGLISGREDMFIHEVGFSTTCMLGWLWQADHWDIIHDTRLWPILAPLRGNHCRLDALTSELGSQVGHHRLRSTYQWPKPARNEKDPQWSHGKSEEK